MINKFFAYAIIFSCSLPSLSMDPPKTPEKAAVREPRLSRRLTLSFLPSSFPSAANESPKGKNRSSRGEKVSKSSKTLPQKPYGETAKNHDAIKLFNQQTKNLHDAISNHDSATVENLLLGNKTLATTDFSPIICACYDDPFYKYPLFMAIKKGNLDTVLLLLDYEVDVNYENIFKKSITGAKIKQSCLAAVLKNARKLDRNWYFIAELLVIKNAALRPEEMGKYSKFLIAIQKITTDLILEVAGKKTLQEASHTKKIQDAIIIKIKNALKTSVHRVEEPSSLASIFARAVIYKNEAVYENAALNGDGVPCEDLVFQVRIYENAEAHKIWVFLIETLIEKGHTLRPEEMEKYGEYYRYHEGVLRARRHRKGEKMVQEILNELSFGADTPESENKIYPSYDSNSSSR